MRVLTWNLWWRYGTWRARQDAILAVLRQERPDVCGLQEVWDGQAAILAEALGMHWAYSPSPAPQRWHERGGGETAGVGNAVLSRWPIDEQAVAGLPGPDGRTVLFARTNGVPFFTTHLHSAPAESGVRVEQVAAVARFIGAQDRSRHPAILTGDCNAEPDSDEMRLLGGRLTAPAAPGLLLVDAWRHATTGDPGATWDNRNPHAKRFGLPPARIDYILAEPPWAEGAPGRGTVRRVWVCGNVPVGGVWPSDHAAVAAEFSS
ncbi:endonuclease/exonuclease/phosphatase family protein [Dactylosporangium sp. CA-139066]|uniref:endonuclease/exonuclease/phosphatase family protein n=1 Tax=Dactylosporangium sp. CA-139066 TaxID=3239930 RepID=UPI003D94F0C0